MDLAKARNSYIEEGLDYQNATARTCRDAVVSLIAGSRMADCVTVKGGVVMQQISGDSRRATRDIDLDFVRYPMTEEGIRAFVAALCREGVDEVAFDKAMHVLVYDDEGMRENSAADAHRRLERVLNDRRFRRNLSNARNNWLSADVGKVVAGILRHIG